MYQILLGSLGISLLHSLLPNHWLPIIAIGKREGWSSVQVLRVTLMAGAAHAFSTVLIGSIIALLGWKLSQQTEHFTHYAAPVMLIALGLFFLYRHHTHHHFHLRESSMSQRRIIWTLAAAMFFSPCLEIEGFYLLAGAQGAQAVLLLSLVYFSTSLTGMIAWVWVVHKGLKRLDWHGLEHNVGMISGIVLILSGILSFFV